MSSLAELRKALDAATGPSRELDSAIARYLGWHRVEPRFTKNRKGAWISPSEFLGLNNDGSPRLDSLHGTEMQRDPPPLSHSIDAALGLVERLLPGCHWALFDTSGPKLNIPFFQIEPPGGPDDPFIAGTAPTAPLAILRALVAALEDEGSTK